MSLRVWLPLNGDLHNQGISNVTITAPSGVTVDNAGKIGKCYTSAGTANGSVNTCELNMSQFSIAAWVRINTRTNSWNCSFKLVDNSDANSYQYCGFCCEHNSDTTKLGFHFYSVIDGTNTGIFDAYPAIISNNNWHHFAFAYDGVHVTYYQDGAVLSTATIVSARQNTLAHFKQLIMFGANGSRAASTIKTSLNDIRIYDHCLSAAEVKEIAQGLVLHYKLDGQYGASSLNLLPCGDTYTKDSPRTVTSNRTDGNSWVPNSAFEAKPSTTYTISVECDGNLSNAHGNGGMTPAQKPWTFWLYICNVDTTKNWSNGQYDTPVNLTSTNNNYRKIGNVHVWTYTLSSTQKYISLRTNNYSDGSTDLTINYWNMKVEEGNTYTPWMPSYMNNTNNIQDSSGYNHNGEILNGPLSLTSDTPRYNISTHFSATNQKIKISNFPTSGFGNSYTFAWWAKISSVTPMHWGFGDGIRLNGMYTGRLWNTGDGSNNPLYNPGTTTQVTAPTVNVWHHWVMTGDGTKCRVYQDGELWGEAKTYKAISGTTIYINGWNNTTDYSSNNYSISDFRIYCTQLLDTDIKQLYNVSMKVDKGQNIHTFEFNEATGRTQFLKTSVIKSAQVADNLLFDNKAHIGKHSYENILPNNVNIATTKNGHIANQNTLTAIPAEKIQSLAGKTLRFTYDVKADGTRSSTENNQTAWNYIRYGIHATFQYTNASGTTGTSYPFAGYLNYSGPAQHAIQTWTVPTGYQSYGALSFSVQNFDKPASTNNSTWFIQNVRLEVVETTSNGFVTGNQIIER